MGEYYKLYQKLKKYQIITLLDIMTDKFIIRGEIDMKMLAFTVLSVATLVSASMADTQANPQNTPQQNREQFRQEHFQEMKQKILSHIQQREQFLEELKNCITNAQNHQDMQACRAKHKEELQSIKGQQGIRK